jgi:hypothetical protein
MNKSFICYHEISFAPVKKENSWLVPIPRKISVCKNRPKYGPLIVIPITKFTATIVVAGSGGVVIWFSLTISSDYSQELFFEVANIF